MANPIKVIKGVSKVAKRTIVGSNKDVKAHKFVNKKLEQAFGTKTISKGKAKSIAREKKYGTASYKVAKQNDSFVNQYAKYAKKSGSNLTGNQALAEAVAPKSVSKKIGPKVPVKKRGK